MLWPARAQTHMHIQTQNESISLLHRCFLTYLKWFMMPSSSLLYNNSLHCRHHPDPQLSNLPSKAGIALLSVSPLVLQSPEGGSSSSSLLKGDMFLPCPSCLCNTDLYFCKFLLMKSTRGFCFLLFLEFQPKSGAR